MKVCTSLALQFLTKLLVGFLIKNDCRFETNFIISGNVKAKLCRGDFTQDLEIYCSRFPDYCLHCLSKRCNLAVNINEYVDCVNCDSNLTEDCAKNSNYLETRKCYKNCMKILWPSENNEESRVIQGCLDDLEIDEQEDCNKFGHCRLLEGNICYL